MTNGAKKIIQQKKKKRNREIVGICSVQNNDGCGGGRMMEMEGLI